MSDPVHIDNLISVEDLAAASALSKGWIRKQLLHRKSNGLDAAVVRAGRRLLLDKERFGVWLAQFREKG